MEMVGELIYELIEYINTSISDVKYGEEDIEYHVGRVNTIVDIIKFRSNRITREIEECCDHPIIRGINVTTNNVIKVCETVAKTLLFQHSIDKLDLEVVIDQSAILHQLISNIRFSSELTIDAISLDKIHNSRVGSSYENDDIPDDEDNKIVKLKPVTNGLVKIPLSDGTPMGGRIFMVKGTKGILLLKTKDTFKYIGKVEIDSDDLDIDALTDKDKESCNHIPNIKGNLGCSLSERAIGLIQGNDNYHEIIKVMKENWKD